VERGVDAGEMAPADLCTGRRPSARPVSPQHAPRPGKRKDAYAKQATMPMIRGSASSDS